MFDNMFETKKTLIVVYKDELLLNQLRKMVETKDDEEDKVVGTKDGSLNIVGWTEKVWLDNKKAGTISDKILFLGPIKETDNLIPTLDMKFNSFGAFFGISGNQAVLYANTKLLNKNDVYNAFLIKLSSCPIPDFLKTPAKTEVVASNTVEKQSNLKILNTAKNFIGKAVDQVGDKAEEIFRNKTVVERQIMLYGLNMLYNGFLEEYMSL